MNLDTGKIVPDGFYINEELCDDDCPGCNCHNCSPCGHCVDHLIGIGEDILEKQCTCGADIANTSHSNGCDKL